jgi:hypothetical protein
MHILRSPKIQNIHEVYRQEKPFSKAARIGAGQRAHQVTPLAKAKWDSGYASEMAQAVRSVVIERHITDAEAAGCEACHIGQRTCANW